jgi:hypothetical protein
MPRVLPFAIGAAATLLVAGPAIAATPPRTTPIVVKVTHGGFSLADAAVGAIAGGGAVIATAGLVALMRLRREESNPPRKGETQ